MRRIVNNELLLEDDGMMGYLSGKGLEKGVSGNSGTYQTTKCSQSLNLTIKS